MVVVVHYGVGNLASVCNMLRRAGAKVSISGQPEEILAADKLVLPGVGHFDYGMKMLDASGLGWLDMRCLRLPDTPDLRVPHMGWAQVRQERPYPLLDNAAADARYYFVHAYFMQCADATDVAGTSMHGMEFCSVVQRGHIFGTQFHPEKSLRHGLALMRAFAEFQPDE